MFNSDNFYMFSCGLNVQVTFEEKPQLKTMSFQNYKEGFVIPQLQGTVVNWALLSLCQGSLEITPTVPLNMFLGECVGLSNSISSFTFALQIYCKYETKLEF